MPSCYFGVYHIICIGAYLRYLLVSDPCYLPCRPFCRRIPVTFPTHSLLSSHQILCCRHPFLWTLLFKYTISAMIRSLENYRLFLSQQIICKRCGFAGSILFFFPALTLSSLYRSDFGVCNRWKITDFFFHSKLSVKVVALRDRFYSFFPL